MNKVTTIPLKKRDIYITEIVVLEGGNEKSETRLPFFADGYPGIMYNSSGSEVIQLPLNKNLSKFIIYGQTITPIELLIRGKYKLIIFQMFPSAIKSLFGINPRELNDNCFDLSAFDHGNPKMILKKLSKQNKTSSETEIILDFIKAVKRNDRNKNSETIFHAVNLVLDSKGTISVKELCERLKVGERTLQRIFISHIGISPKQLAKIIQFKLSLTNVANEEFQKLSDVAYDSGFADQSHFIRAFKKFTGSTPSKAKSQGLKTKD